jgi:hypothetical protein
VPASHLIRRRKGDAKLSGRDGRQAASRRPSGRHVDPMALASGESYFRRIVSTGDKTVGPETEFPRYSIGRCVMSRAWPACCGWQRCCAAIGDRPGGQRAAPDERRTATRTLTPRDGRFSRFLGIRACNQSAIPVPDASTMPPRIGMARAGAPCTARCEQNVCRRM